MVEFWTKKWEIEGSSKVKSANIEMLQGHKSWISNLDQINNLKAISRDLSHDDHVVLLHVKTRATCVSMSRWLHSIRWHGQWLIWSFDRKDSNPQPLNEQSSFQTDLIITIRYIIQDIRPIITEIFKDIWQVNDANSLWNSFLKYLQ